jgi:hypothetical protein
VFSAKDQLMAPEVNPSEALDAVGALLALRSGAGASATLHIFQEFLRLRYDSSGNKFKTYIFGDKSYSNNFFHT